MSEEALKQRIQFILEHGKVWPDDQPAPRSLLIKLVGAILIMETLNFLCTIVMHIHNHWLR